MSPNNPIEFRAIRCLRDNYAWLIHGNGETALIDAPEAAPILAALAENGWSLDHILLTHHHADHIQAVPELLKATKAKVIGATADAHRLPPLDQMVAPGDRLTLCGTEIEVMDVSGHTMGHVAFHLPQAKLAFTGDSLMSLGCGRLFEGQPQDMWASLTRLMALSPETRICSGHDYCAANGAFALTIDPENPNLDQRLRETANGTMPCSPTTLAVEMTTNPFLRVAKLRPLLGMAGAGDLEVFARLRAMKDDF